MAKQPGQLGQNTIWDGPLQPSNLVPGDSRYGNNCMKISQAPVPYSPGPVTKKAQANSGGGRRHMSAK
jgi:hypothetical protein